MFLNFSFELLNFFFWWSSSRSIYPFNEVYIEPGVTELCFHPWEIYRTFQTLNVNQGRVYRCRSGILILSVVNATWIYRHSGQVMFEVHITSNNLLTANTNKSSSNLVNVPENLSAHRTGQCRSITVRGHD